MIKKHSVIKNILVGTALLTLVACSSTRHHGDGSEDGMGGGANGNGVYTEGLGSGSGFQPSTSCNVPQLGGKTQSYYFAYDKSDVHPDDVNRLQSLASHLAAGNTKINVVGNTDNRGSREYNIALGWRRANAIASTLEQGGVSKQRVNTNSNGAEKPIAFGTSEDDFQCNRRVDIVEKN